MANQQQAWQELLNRAAYFNIMATPDPQQANVPVPMPGGTGRLAGVQVHGIGHRFDVTLQPPTVSGGLRASNAVGPAVLDCHFRFLPVPDDFWATPDREPPPTPLDPGRGQRFVIRDGEFRFGPGGENRFSSFGTGQTFPLPAANGGTLGFAAIGAILEGSYKFEHCQGVYVMSGFFTLPYDFRLNIMLRVNDLDGTFLTETVLPPVEATTESVLGTTYFYVHTIAEPETTQLTLGPGGAPQRLETMEKITLDQLHFAVQGMYGLKSSRKIGAVIGQHPLTARFFPTPATLGTPASPVPFDDTEEFIFTDSHGTVLGSIQAPVIEGRAVLTPLAGIPQQIAPQIFGGFAPITGSTGQFAGMTGMVTNVGGGTVGPHLSDIIYMFQLTDPTGKYRVTAGHTGA